MPHSAGHWPAVPVCFLCSAHSSSGRGPGLARQRRAVQHPLLAPHPNHSRQRREAQGRLDATTRTTRSKIRKCRATPSSWTACSMPPRRSCAWSRSTPRPGAKSGPSIPTPAATPTRRYRHRGVTVYKDRVFFTYRNFLYALDRRTGKPIAAFGDNGRIDLRQGLDRPPERASISASSPGVIFEDMIIMGSTVPETLPGIARPHPRLRREHRQAALDLPHHSASRRIRLRNLAAGGVQDLRRRQRVGRPQRRSRSSAWSSPPPARRRSISTAPTGIGDNLFADCVLALDARTGKRIWHFQGIRHDVWDYDFPAAPSLVTVTRNGRKVDAVAQITKTGYVYVLDRRTGEPLFPIGYNARCRRRRSMAKSWPRRSPIRVKPPPFTRQSFTEDMITNRTPEAHAGGAGHFPEARFQRHLHAAQPARHAS